MNALSRRLLLPALLLALVPATGCDGLWPGGGDSQGQDTTAVGDTVRDTTLVADTASPADTIPAGDTVPVPDTTSAGDTLPPPDTTADAASPADTLLPADLQERLERLEARNDSLEQTILGLVALQGRDREPRRDTAGTAGELLSMGADEVKHWGIRIFLTLLFLVLLGLFTKGVTWVLDRLAEQNAKRRLFFKRLVPVSRILIWVLALPFAALVILGIEAQGLVAAGAAVGVAVGFAAQDILKNVFGGFIVLFDQPFQVGDKVRVGENYGEVVNIGLRSTRIVTPDDNLVTVPNAQMVDNQVANANAGELNCQVVTDLWLPGHVDEALAKRLAFEAAASSRYVYLNKPIVVLVLDEFDKAFLTHLKVKAYVLDPRYEFVFMSDVTERARAAFREAGILAPLDGPGDDGGPRPGEIAGAASQPVEEPPGTGPVKGPGAGSGAGPGQDRLTREASPSRRRDG